MVDITTSSLQLVLATTGLKHSLHPTWSHPCPEGLQLDAKPELICSLSPSEPPYLDAFAPATISFFAISSARWRLDTTWADQLFFGLGYRCFLMGGCLFFARVFVFTTYIQGLFWVLLASNLRLETLGCQRGAACAAAWIWSSQGDVKRA